LIGFFDVDYTERQNIKYKEKENAIKTNKISYLKVPNFLNMEQKEQLHCSIIKLFLNKKLNFTDSLISNFTENQIKKNVLLI
jgi:hypothetical protein